MKINPPWLCLITSDSRSKGHDLVQLVHEAVSGGVNMVQLRTGITDHLQLTKLASQIRDITSGKSLFLVNSNLKLAITSGADGVHFKEREVIPKNLKNEIKMYSYIFLKFCIVFMSRNILHFAQYNSLRRPYRPLPMSYFLIFYKVLHIAKIKFNKFNFY